MTSRREFIRSGAALAAVAASLPASAALVRPDTVGAKSLDSERLEANRAQSPGLPRSLRVLCDRGCAESAAFAAEASARGAAVDGFDGDVASAWMNGIEPRWKLRPAAVAGLTEAGALFCLEYLARDYGMAVAYRIEHASRAGAGVHHEVTGPDFLSARARALAGAASSWPARAAALAVAWPADLRPEAPIPLLDLASSRLRAGRTLYSWMIVPMRASHLALTGHSTRTDDAETTAGH